MTVTRNGGAMSPQCTDGLCIAIFNDKSGIEKASALLAETMESEGAHSGILLVGSVFARSFFGPVPQEWISKGIGIVVGGSDELNAEAEALFKEYALGLAAAHATLHRLEHRARQSAGQDMPRQRLEPKVSGERNSQHDDVDPFAAQAPRAQRPPARQQSAMSSMGATLQKSESASSMASDAGRGNMQGGGTQGAGSHDPGASHGAGAAQSPGGTGASPSQDMGGATQQGRGNQRS